MQSSLYVALSAQVALQNRLDTIAQNVANGSTAGYRGTEVKFDSLLSRMSDAPVHFVSSGNKVIKQTAGEFVKTGNPLDVAIKGKGWLSFTSADGQAYTRDGRMQMTSTGALVTMSGAAVLDPGGAPIQLDPTGGSPDIASDGVITQRGRRMGSLGLFLLDNNAQLSRVEGGLLSSIAGTAVPDRAEHGVLQGFVEQSNVNPVSEMARLIYVQRAFEGVSATINSAESTLKSSIQTLGSPT